VTSVHPDVAAWIERIQGSASPSTAERLEAHLAACPTCREIERDLRRVMEAMAADRLLEPSPGAVRAVLNAFRPRRDVPSPGWARGLPERIARVLFDTLAAPQQAFAGARAAAAARRLRFESDALELDALLESEGDRLRLTAQLLTTADPVAPVPGARFLVAVGGRVEAEGVTDADGELACLVPPGDDVELRLAAGGSLCVFRVPGRR
jgi:hypothetical protein